MRGTVVAALAMTLGCAVAPTPRSASGTWPTLCPETSAEVGREPGEPPLDCWRQHFPIVPCEGAEHPELVGLWGAVHGRTRHFEPELVYDGCSATIRVAPIQQTLCGPATYAVRGDLGLGEANRTRARWDGETLYAVSAIHRGQGGERAWARRTASNGEWRFELLRTFGPTVPLVRLRAPRCIDSRAWELICARRVVPTVDQAVGGACGGEPPGG